MYSKVTLLGTRGSMAVSGPEYAKYGGATTCAVVTMDGETVALDAGTGILKLASALPEGTNKLPLILTHPHADHLMGLPMCSLTLKPDFSFEIYAKTRFGLGARAQLESFMTLPIWPIGPDKFPAAMSFNELPESFTLGGISVTVMEGNHPGGVSLVRLDKGGRSVVFATDCVINESLFPAFARFAGSPDLLLIDGQYSQKEYDAHPAFGHNSWCAAAKVGLDINAKKTLIIHHDVSRTDDFLDAVIPEVQAINPTCLPAFEGQEVIL